MKQEGAMKRERALSYALSQLVHFLSFSRANPKIELTSSNVIFYQ